MRDSVSLGYPNTEERVENDYDVQGSIFYEIQGVKMADESDETLS